MKAIIFDLDGVLCHTDKLHYKAWKQIADQYGIYFDETINNRLRGVSRMDSLAIILERYTGDVATLDREAMAAAKNDYYRELLKTMSPADVAPEVLQTLHALRAKGLKLAVGSSSKNTDFILSQIGLDGFFDAVSDGNGLQHSKPNPEVFLRAAALLGVAPADCFVVEDAEAGLQAARRGGMQACGFGDAVDSTLADVHLRHFADLLAVASENDPLQ